MSEVPTKENVVDKAVSLDTEENRRLNPSIIYSRGYRQCIRDLLPYIQDYYKNRVRKIIE